MPDTYTLQVAGVTRELPICKINEHLSIAAMWSLQLPARRHFWKSALSLT